ncbi:hypothetical protein [Marinobacter sp. DUT-1]|uniref:hypothetical protein n=1 Tax=Marinobacter sp. DUT-1 TaxID=3412037 RepID=UPI003D17309F
MFQLVFKGECVAGTDEQTARNNARALFKASVEQVERMFSGQPVVIRNKLEEAQAEKYRAVLKKHGMVAYVQPMPGARPTPAPSPSGTQASSPTPDEPVPKPAASTPARASGGATPKVEPGDRLPVAGEKVDDILAGSGLDLDPVGVTLAEHQEAEAPMFEHLDDWTLAPAGSDLGVERELPPPMVPDVSHLSLVDEDDKDKP